MYCRLLGSSVHGILQAKILEEVPIPFSRGTSWPRDWTRSTTLQADSSPSDLRRSCKHTDTHRAKAMWCQRQRSQWYSYKPGHLKDWEQLPEARKSDKGPFPGASRGSTVLLTPWLWLPAPSTGREHVGVVWSRRCVVLVTAALGDARTWSGLGTARRGNKAQEPSNQVGSPRHSSPSLHRTADMEDAWCDKQNCQGTSDTWGSQHGAPWTVQPGKAPRCLQHSCRHTG